MCLFFILSLLFFGIVLLKINHREILDAGCWLLVSGLKEVNQDELFASSQ